MKPERKKTMQDLRDERDQNKKFWLEASKEADRLRSLLWEISDAAGCDFTHHGEEYVTKEAIRLIQMSLTPKVKT